MGSSNSTPTDSDIDSIREISNYQRKDLNEKQRQNKLFFLDSYLLKPLTEQLEFFVPKSQAEQTNSEIQERILMINKIYSINEENLNETAKELISYIKDNCPTQVKYWFRLIFHSLYIRHRSTKLTLFLLKQLNNAFPNSEFLFKIVGKTWNLYLIQSFYRAGIISEELYCSKYSDYGNPKQISSLDSLCKYYSQISVEYYIMNDWVFDYQKYMLKSSNQFTDFLQCNYSMIYAIDNEKVSHNQFAAFYGALNCYKFARINGSNLPDIEYALTSGNQYLLNISIPNNQLFQSELFTTAIKFHQPNSVGFLMQVYNFDLKHSCKLEDTIQYFNEQFFYLFAEEAMADIKSKQIINIEGSLITSSKYDSLETMSFLLENHLDTISLLNSINALHIACSHGNYEMVKLLVSYNVNVNTKSKVPFYFLIDLICK